MAISSKLLKELEAHQFKNKSVITYAELNNPDDKKSPTDVANEIYNTFFNSKRPSKDQKTMLDAIFDNVYTVVENGSKNAKTAYMLLDPKKGVSSELDIFVNSKGALVFDANNASISIQFTIHTPEVVEKTTSDDILKLENEKLKELGVEITSKTLKPKDYATISEVFANMAKVAKVR